MEPVSYIALLVFAALLGAMTFALYDEKRRRRNADANLFKQLTERTSEMATKEELAKAVADLKAGDAANKTTIANLKADNAAKDTQIQSLQSQLADAQAAAAAADKVDDSIVSDIESVAADLNPPAQAANPLLGGN